MKLAIAGKGGVGKTTFAAAIGRLRVRNGRRVIVVDADPDGNLPAALGVPPERVPMPIARMKQLILERTQVPDANAGPFFKLNPRVDDLPERFSVDAGGIKLLVLGTVETGGKGCLCPEGTMIKALLQHLLLRVPEDVVLDMEAGLEHAGPGLTWLRGLVSQDGAALRRPTVFQLVLRDGKLEVVVLGRRFTLG
jgi:CO dehydrogenase maturation factor